MHALTGAGWAMNKETGGNRQTFLLKWLASVICYYIWKKYIISTYCFTLAQTTAKNVAVIPYNEHLQEMHCPFTATVTNGKVTFS